jgi:hypothetical protein
MYHGRWQAHRSNFVTGPGLPLRRLVIESRQPPTLLTEKILSVEEVVELFNMWVFKSDVSPPSVTAHDGSTAIFQS